MAAILDSVMLNTKFWEGKTVSGHTIVYPEPSKVLGSWRVGLDVKWR